MYGFPSCVANGWVPVSDIVSLVDTGKAGKHLRQGAEIGRQHKSHSLHEYEILLGDPRAVRWVEARGVPNPHNLSLFLAKDPNPLKNVANKNSLLLVHNK